MIVKICGITNVDDARDALDLGADLIGINLVAGPRRIDPDRAATLITALNDPTVAVVLVRLEPDFDPLTVCQPFADLGVKLFQLYGEVTPGAVSELRTAGLSSIFVQSVETRQSLDRITEFLERCGPDRPTYVLLDSHAPGMLGGTGETADWDVITDGRDAGLMRDWPPVILAGGLTPENVAEAIRVVRPAGVDVSSGVESEPGRKEAAKVKGLIAAARSAK